MLEPHSGRTVNNGRPVTGNLDLAVLSRLRLFAHAAHRSERYGERRGRKVGGRIEFVDYRPYAPGDDPRTVDWNVAARTDRLYVKQYVRDVGLPVHLLLDVSGSMWVGAPSPLALAADLTRGLAFVALRHGDVVALAEFGATVRRVTTAQGREGQTHLDRALATLSEERATDCGRALRAYAARARTRGAALVLSDFLDGGGVEEGLLALAARTFEVAAIHLVGREVVAPVLPPVGAVRDAETGSTRDVTWGDGAREAYGRRLRAFLDHRAAWCARHGIRYARVRTDRPVGSVFLTELRHARIVV
jgi:uncharacterized protein (DUF58 family)